MFARGLLDGRLSMIGLWLRLLYFGVTSGSYALDARLKADRWSFLTPALSGLILTIAHPLIIHRLNRVQVTKNTIVHPIANLL